MTTPDPSACPHCGCLDVPRFVDEAPICPHCGAILALTPPDPPSWLAQWPREKRSGVANWFYHAVRRGARTPPAIVAAVVETLHQRLQWTVHFDQRQWLCQVLDTIADDPQHVQAYAAEVLAREQLPPETKVRLKQDKAFPYVLEAMRGKPVTEKQLGYLEALGYTGPAPADRAEASALIDQYVQERHKTSPSGKS